MKKLLLLTLVLVMILAFCACNADNQETTSTEPQLHTLAPEKDPTEVLWCEVYSDLSIKDNDKNELITKDDIKAFAIVGHNDEESYITIQLNDNGKDVLNYCKETLKLKTLYIYVGDKLVYEVPLTNEVVNGEINFGEEKSYNDLCAIAKEIRGV